MDLAVAIDMGADIETVFAPGQLLESCDGDDDLAREVILEFCESAPVRLVRLTLAVANLDLSQVRLEAHSIKGSCRTIGAVALASITAILEESSKNGDLSDATAMVVEADRCLRDLILALRAYHSDSLFAQHAVS